MSVLRVSLRRLGIFSAIWISLFISGSVNASTSSAIVPLNDLGAGAYMGFQGGLYPGGANEMPAQHEAAGLDRAELIQPLNTAGLPDPNGKIVLLSIGMSNTKQEFCGPNLAGGGACNSWTFAGQAAADLTVERDHLVLVNGAQRGRALDWIYPTNKVYNTINTSYLIGNGYSETQVQTIWLKVANTYPVGPLPDPSGDAFDLLSYLGSIIRALKIRYVNLQQVILSSRSYAGYATSTFNPEPFAYESGFSVKWLIEAQINQMAGGGVDPIAGDLDYNSVAPWIAWGPYLWADGLNPRSDGLTWAQSDFEPDGTHPSTAGETKVGTMLLDFFKTSAHTIPWFLDDQVAAGYPVAIAQADPLQGEAPLSVAFDASASDDLDGTIVSYLWDFNDGNTSSAINHTHVFNDPGTYLITLTVTDDLGLSDSANLTIQVDSPPPPCVSGCVRSTSIAFTVTPVSGAFKINGNVSIKDENGLAVSGAAVTATWTLPNGTTKVQVRTSNSNGVARFNVSNTAGIYILTVNDITLTGYPFDPQNSVLSGSVTAQ